MSKKQQIADATNTSKLSYAIDAYPAAFKGNRLNLLFLHDAYPIYDSHDFFKEINGLKLQEERREYLIGSIDGWPFPTIRIEKRPDPWKISEELFEKFHFADKLIPAQHEIGPMLIDLATKKDADTVALIIVDGLSYYDLPATMDAKPCLVKGVTITDFGFRDVLGKPTISQRFFSQGYRNQIAMTFFDKNTSPLSIDLHSTFGSSQLNRINSIEEGVEILKNENLLRGYVQIVAPGLDKLSHYHADRPLLKENIDRIIERLDKIVDCLSEKGRKVIACLTSDHGIMWRTITEEKTEVVGDLLSENIRHPRYVKGSLNRNYTRTVRSRKQSYTLLKAPFMTRAWKHSEWGVHGGISAWESIVPIIIREN